ncbi:hypothetical protein HW132_00930 [Brasilonema sp. CT11]|nr:hypothetical protein [Brasilonema sp. CT11]
MKKFAIKIIDIFQLVGNATHWADSHQTGFGIEAICVVCLSTYSIPTQIGREL